MPIKLHAGQSRMMRSTKRFIIASAGTGSGKSFAGPYWLAAEIAKYPADVWIVSAPTYKILSAATVPNLVTAYSGSMFEGELVSSKNQYLLPDGGVIWFISTDNPHAMQGILARAIWYDEAGLGSAVSWRTIKQRVGFKKGRVLITTPPYGEGWLKEEIDNAKEPGAPVEVVNWSSIDNPHYPKDEYYRAMKDLPRSIFNQLYNGVFSTSEHAIYSDFNENNVRESVYDPTKELLIGSDFNCDPQCNVIGQRHGDELRIIDEIVIRYNAKTQDFLDELFNRYSNHKKGFRFFGDATSQSRHTSAANSDYIQIANDQRFKQLGRFVHYPTTNPPVADRIAAVNGMILNAAGERRLFVDPKCKQLRTDLESACYKEGTRVPDKAKYDAHSGDGLGYLIFAIWPLRVSTTGKVAINTRTW